MIRHDRRERAFTMVELMVVVIILGILATTVSMKVIGMIHAAKVSKAQTEIRSLKDASILYKAKKGKWPGSLKDLVSANLIEEVPDDPWGTPYQYKSMSSPSKVIILSYGEGGAVGGTDEAADISSEELGKATP